MNNKQKLKNAHTLKYFPLKPTGCRTTSEEAVAKPLSIPKTGHWFESAE